MSKVCRSPAPPSANCLLLVATLFLAQLHRPQPIPGPCPPQMPRASCYLFYPRAGVDCVWPQPERRDSCVWPGSHQRGTAWSSKEAEKFPGSGTKGKKKSQGPKKSVRHTGPWRDLLKIMQQVTAGARQKMGDPQSLD